MITPSWLRYTTGSPKIYADNTADSGNPLPRAFCGECGCHFTSGPEGASWTAVKWGTLDEEARRECGEVGGEIYCKRREGWLGDLVGGHGGFTFEGMTG